MGDCNNKLHRALESNYTVLLGRIKTLKAKLEKAVGALETKDKFLKIFADHLPECECFCMDRYALLKAALDATPKSIREGE